jgi:hypothetical protein
VQYNIFDIDTGNNFFSAFPAQFIFILKILSEKRLLVKYLHIRMETISTVFNFFNDLNLKSENVLFTFFILKACGYDNKLYRPLRT